MAMKWGKRLVSPSRTRSHFESKSFMEASPPDTTTTADSSTPSPQPLADINEPRSVIEPRRSPTLAEDRGGVFSPRFGSNIRLGALDLIRKFRGASSTSKTAASGASPKVEEGEEGEEQSSSAAVVKEAKKEKEPKQSKATSKKMAPAASALEERIKASAQVAKPTISKTPRLVLEPNGRDWIMEFYENAESPLKIEETKMNQNIFVRDNTGATLQISKKFNNLTLENCQSVNVVVDSVISAIELIRCKKCQIQVLGHAQSITIDNCQGINVYASLESKQIQITSSQNAEINLHVPESEENKDNWIELPIPCQFVHTIKPNSNTLDTKVSDLYH